MSTNNPQDKALEEAAASLMRQHDLEAETEAGDDEPSESDGSIEASLGMSVVPRSELHKPKVFPRYTAAAMVQLMIDNPRYTPKQLAAHFGYKESWFAGVIVSLNFQQALESRRSEVHNPVYAGTMDDMLRGLLFQSVMVIQKKLEEGKASEDFIIKAGALGVKALGLGSSNQAPTTPAQPASLEDLAHRMAQKAAALPSSSGTAVDRGIENALGDGGNG